MIRLLARLLRNVRAGEHKLVWHESAIAAAPISIALTSPAFEPGAPIPLQHAGKGVGTNVSPALVWKGAPLETAEFVLIVEDPDAPLPRPFVHAIVIGIPPESSKLAEGALSALLPTSQGMLGRNSFGLAAYVGPRALPGHSPHTYVFQILALGKRLSFAASEPPRVGRGA